MRAIVQDGYGDTDVLRLEDIEPPVPGPGEVLVRVRAAGVDPGVWHLMAGLPYAVRLGFGLRRPKVRTRGADVAGVVEAVGPDVAGFAPGDEVFGEGGGTFAEFALVPATALARKPANVGFAEAAVVPISGTTALQGLRDSGGIEAGQHVLVLGASGGVGSFAVQLAKSFGARVTAVASTGKLEFVRSLGADDVIDYTREDPVDGSRRFHLILDTGGNRSLRRLRTALAPNGTLVIVGGKGGGRITGGFDRAMLRAPLLSRFTRQRLRGLLAVARAADLDTLRELIEAGTVRPPLDRTFSLEQAPDAIRSLRAGDVRGKLAVVI
jgi:NADPH:quinone reductase-like Zn-dependent oxidoreductase